MPQSPSSPFIVSGTVTQWSSTGPLATGSVAMLNAHAVSMQPFMCTLLTVTGSSYQDVSLSIRGLRQQPPPSSDFTLLVSKPRGVKVAAKGTFK